MTFLKLSILFLFALRIAFAADEPKPETADANCKKVRKVIAGGNLSHWRGLIQLGEALPYRLDQVPARNQVKFPDRYKGFPPFSSVAVGMIVNGIHKGPPYPTEISRISKDKKFIELSSLDGQKFYYEQKGNDIFLRTQNQTSFTFADHSAYRPPARAAFDSDLTPLATQMAESQVSTSTTYKAAGPTEKARIKEGLVKANLEMLELVKSGESLTVDHMSGWNKEIGAVTPLGDEPQGQVAAGILRGKKKLVERVEEDFDIDMTQTYILGDYEQNKFIPYSAPEDVPRKMDELVAQINQISTTSKLVDIVKIMREFVTIHPYIDHNGRTGQVVLNFCLLKAGFPPAPSFPTKLYKVLYSSPYDARDALVEAYQLKYK